MVWYRSQRFCFFPMFLIAPALFIEKIIFSPHLIEVIPFGKPNGHICMFLFLASLLYCSICLALHQCQDGLTTTVLQLYCKSRSGGRRPPDLFKTVLATCGFCIITYSLESCLPIFTPEEATLILIEATLSPQINLRRINSHIESSNTLIYSISPFIHLHLGLP